MAVQLKGFMPQTSENQDLSAERRQHLYLREIFEEAYRISLPFLDPGQGFRGVSFEHHVFVVLHEEYPVLTQYQLAVLVRALERIFHERRQTG